ncbi:DVU_1553 family AMP-dependent CoA ligase [Desulfomicrobium baculatum]|uniref:Coenzyme F390 synthetase-like protein n=1 Tax=Desulfomicrobium baculatum (strain DSM 4028 / VKM B-1378 / X) TaxID=525897 RepID=C7LUB4_DESBD|nr:AMP-binding protein [Desulfomicrobium baculatum]ACU89649.1 coenzyme F390 synthetase-like protein [Desulfomicrobium baculatum DSM 4028]
MNCSSVDALTARRLGLSLPLERSSLETAQMASLRRTVEHACAKSPWYRERLAGFDPASLRTSADLSRLPLLSSDELAAHGPRLVCVSQSEVARIITLQTSGSTGSPKRLHFTHDDLDVTVDFFLHGMLSLISPVDNVLALLPFTQPDSTGALLLQALGQGGVRCAGFWPPTDWEDLAEQIRSEGYSCLVGLPQHLLTLAYALPHGLVRSMLLCSDYAPPMLRTRIEEASGCETFLHYGTTETGLGGGVECGAHDGCHLRESDLLVEVVHPHTGQPMPEGEPGEVVVTTLGRRAMPLLRYRTGDLARLVTQPCVCGGVTARLCAIQGRQTACRLAGGFSVTSQDLDDALFALDGLLDYRATLGHANGCDLLGIEFLARPGHEHVDRELSLTLAKVPAIASALAQGGLRFGPMLRVSAFSPSHTVKRTLFDQRGSRP